MSLLKILFYQAKQIKLSNCSSNCSNSLIHHMTSVIWCFPLYFTLVILAVEEQRTNAKSEQEEIPPENSQHWRDVGFCFHWKISGCLVDQCRWLPSGLIAAQSCLVPDKEIVVPVVWRWLYIQIFNFNYLFKRVVLLSSPIFTNGIYNASIFERRVEYLLPEGSIHFKLTWTAFKFRALAKSFVNDKGEVFYMRWACATPGCSVSFGSLTWLAENGHISLMKLNLEML